MSQNVPTREQKDQILSFLFGLPDMPRPQRNAAADSGCKEAEEAVLGSIFWGDPHETLWRIISHVRLLPHHFKDDNCRDVYVTMIMLFLYDEPIDFLTVCNKLEQSGKLAKVGGAAYISHLINVVATDMHAEGYARIVAKPV